MSWYNRAKEIHRQAQANTVELSDHEARCVSVVIESRDRRPNNTDDLRAALERCEVTIRPEDVVVRIGGASPLVDVFYNVEREVAAAYMVMACQDKGEWGWMRLPDIGEAVKKRLISGTEGTLENIQKGPRPADGYEWMANPFCQPHMHTLVEHGYAVFGERPADGKAGPIRFSPFGLLCLQASRWNKAQGRSTGTE